MAGNGTLSSLRVGTATRPVTNAAIDFPGAGTGLRSGFTYIPAVPPGQLTFTIGPVVPGQPVTVPLIVVDGCGPWETFVGGGPAAF